MGNFTKVPLTNKSVDPGPPYADADWFNRVDDGVDRAHQELDAHEERLDALENTPAPSTTLDGLSDVALTNPQAGQVVKYDGTNWTNQPDLTGGGGGGGSMNVERNGSLIVEAPTTLNLSTAFSVTANGTEADVDVPIATQSAPGRMSSGDKTKLDSIEANAMADMTALEIRTALATVDGASSGIDADLLDRQNSDAFAPSSHIGSGGSVHPGATQAAAGFMSATDKQKLGGLSGGGYTPPWAAQSGAGALLAGFGDGDVRYLFNQWTTDNTVNTPTPTQVTTTISRTVKFRLPVTLAVSKIYVGLGLAVAGSSLYHFALYGNEGVGERHDRGDHRRLSRDNWRELAYAGRRRGLRVGLRRDQHRYEQPLVHDIAAAGG